MTVPMSNHWTWLKHVCAVGRRSKRSLLWIWNRWGPCIPYRVWQKKHRNFGHQALRTWRPEKPSKGTLDVPVTNWTSCDADCNNQIITNKQTRRNTNYRHGTKKDCKHARAGVLIHTYFCCIFIAHFGYTAPEPLNLRRISSIRSAVPESGNALIQMNMTHDATTNEALTPY
jgi:hypothetical protein